jgi:hypothetical protein
VESVRESLGEECKLVDKVITGHARRRRRTNEDEEEYTKKSKRR